MPIQSPIQASVNRKLSMAVLARGATPGTPAGADSRWLERLAVLCWACDGNAGNAARAGNLSPGQVRGSAGRSGSGAGQARSVASLLRGSDIQARGRAWRSAAV